MAFWIGLLSLLASSAHGFFTCTSNYTVPLEVDMAKKGICLDDTTFDRCPTRMPIQWPNTPVTPGSPVTSMRLFKPWAHKWGGAEERLKAWEDLHAWLKQVNGKVLMGVEITCNATEDDLTWGWAVELMKKIGREHIMGLAVGNEQDVFKWNGYTMGKCDTGPAMTPSSTGACITPGGQTPDPAKGERCWDIDGFNALWNGRMWEQIESRITEFDGLWPGEAKLPVTTVWAGGVLKEAPGLPWKEDDEAKVNTIMQKAWQTYGDRWIWSFNIYAIWDTGFWPTNEADCYAKTKASVSMSYVLDMLVTYRERIAQTRGDAGGKIWVGEIGWSSPGPSGTAKKIEPFCPIYYSHWALQTCYDDFMSWDLSIRPDLMPVDHAFYFTMRDSYAAEPEGFGLISSCEDNTCKLSSFSEKPPGVEGVVDSSASSSGNSAPLGSSQSSLGSLIGESSVGSTGSSSSGYTTLGSSGSYLVIWQWILLIAVLICVLVALAACCSSGKGKGKKKKKSSKKDAKPAEVPAAAPAPVEESKEVDALLPTLPPLLPLQPMNPPMLASSTFAGGPVTYPAPMTFAGPTTVAYSGMPARPMTYATGSVV